MNILDRYARPELKAVDRRKCTVAPPKSQATTNTSCADVAAGVSAHDIMSQSLSNTANGGIRNTSTKQLKAM